MIQIKGSDPFKVGGGIVTERRTAERRLAEIEETQSRLRESIEQSKRLAAKSDALLRRHRTDAKRDDQGQQQR